MVYRGNAVSDLISLYKAVGGGWYGAARQAGVTERDCELIRSAFAYEGFGYNLNDPTIHTDDAEELLTARTAR